MREIFHRVSVTALLLTVAVLFTTVPVAGQEPEEEQATQLEDWERAELQSLVQAVGSAVRGELALNENPFALQTDFLKGTEGMTYVPFTMVLDPAQVSASTVAVYLFVTAHQDESVAPADSDDDDAAEVPTAVFEDAYFIDVSAEGSGAGPIYLSRAFNAPGGDYDVYIAMRDSLGGPPQGDQETLSVLMLREQVSVPNLWTTELQTSSLLLADVVEPLTAPLSALEQTRQPYTLGTTRIIPKHDTSFGKQEELSLIMLVYNPQLTGDRKPDLTIEYNFHQRNEGGEEFFNKTNPQQFNAQTLPPGFDVALGHQIVAGQSVPLALFPAGDYRLEITISDNEAGTSLTREVSFTVRET